MVSHLKYLETTDYFSFEDMLMVVISYCIHTVILSVSKTVLSLHGIKTLSIYMLF